MDANAQLAGQRVGLLAADSSQMVRDQLQALARAERVAVAPLPEVEDGAAQPGAQLGTDICKAIKLALHRLADLVSDGTK